MPSKLNANLLSAVMLAALLQLAPGAPVEDAPSGSLAGDTSGEEGETLSDLLSTSPVLTKVLATTERHKEEFEDEFRDVQYLFLDNYKTSSLPEKCPKSNFNKEACLHRLAHGLLIYTVLLKFVEKECPNSLIPKEARVDGGNLISLIKGKMRNPQQVTALTSSQEEVLLKDLEDPDTFRRKMTAHSILRQLHYFLVDCKRIFNKMEWHRRNIANRITAPVTF